MSEKPAKRSGAASEYPPKPLKKKEAKELILAYVAPEGGGGLLAQAETAYAQAHANAEKSRELSRITKNNPFLLEEERLGKVVELLQQLKDGDVPKIANIFEKAYGAIDAADKAILERADFLLFGENRTKKPDLSENEKHRVQEYYVGEKLTKDGVVRMMRRIESLLVVHTPDANAWTVDAKRKMWLPKHVAQEIAEGRRDKTGRETADRTIEVDTTPRQKPDRKRSYDAGTYDFDERKPEFEPTQVIPPTPGPERDESGARVFNTNRREPRSQEDEERRIKDAFIRDLRHIVEEGDLINPDAQRNAYKTRHEYLNGRASLEALQDAYVDFYLSECSARGYAGEDLLEAVYKGVKTELDRAIQNKRDGKGRAPERKRQPVAPKPEQQPVAAPAPSYQGYEKRERAQPPKRKGWRGFLWGAAAVLTLGTAGMKIADEVRTEEAPRTSPIAREYDDIGTEQPASVQEARVETPDPNRSIEPRDTGPAERVSIQQGVAGAREITYAEERENAGQDRPNPGN